MLKIICGDHKTCKDDCGVVTDLLFFLKERKRREKLEMFTEMEIFKTC